MTRRVNAVSKQDYGFATRDRLELFAQNVVDCIVKPCAAACARATDRFLNHVSIGGGFALDLDAVAHQMTGFSYADAERVCLEAIKSMLLGGAKEMTIELLERELTEQRARLALAKGQHDRTT